MCVCASVCVLALTPVLVTHLLPNENKIPVFCLSGGDCFGGIMSRPLLPAQMQSRTHTPVKLGLEGNKQGVI